MLYYRGRFKEDSRIPFSLAVILYLYDQTSNFILYIQKFEKCWTPVKKF